MRNSPSQTRQSAGAAQAFGTILWSGSIAGTLDIAWAIVHTLLRGGNPLAMLRFIAGGVLGAEALKGGFGTSMLGLSLHFVIAFGAAAVFYGLSLGMPWIVRRPLMAGLFYGVAVWLVMNLVVLRWSAWHTVKFPPNNWVPTLVAHLLCVGVPIALITARRSSPEAWRRASGV